MVREAWGGIPASSPLSCSRQKKGEAPTSPLPQSSSGPSSRSRIVQGNLGLSTPILGNLLRVVVEVVGNVGIVEAEIERSCFLSTVLGSGLIQPSCQI